VELVQECVPLAKLIIIWTARRVLALLVMLDSIPSSVQLNVWTALMKIAMFVLALVLTSVHLVPLTTILTLKPALVPVAGMATSLQLTLPIPVHVWHVIMQTALPVLPTKAVLAVINASLAML